MTDSHEPTKPKPSIRDLRALLRVGDVDHWGPPTERTLKAVERALKGRLQR